MTFQDLIMNLDRYWADRGCVIVQPHDTEVGAGTFYPTTFLRALGPDAWRAAGVAPSRRPARGHPPYLSACTNERTGPSKRGKL